MTNADEEARKAYAESGVDLPELKEEKKEEAPEQKPEEKPEAKPEAKTEEAPAKPEGEKPEDKAPLQIEPKEQKPRSIYDEYKDKKAELKSERELREQAERERDELKATLEAAARAVTPKQKQDAADELEAFAQKIKADPAAIREMRDLFLKGHKPEIDEALLNDLKEFKDWKAQNAEAIEAQRFEAEFQQSQPALKELFPAASPEEMQAIKKELDVLSHTKEFHDKPLDYVAFKHKEKLGALISPRRRGMESNERKHDAESDSFEFDPSADLSKMTPKQAEQWERHYRSLGKSDALLTGADGKKLII